MEFQLYPVTLNYWGNYYTAQWDIYAQANPMDYDCLENDMKGSIPLFKSDIMEDYYRYRSMMQVLDLLILDLYSFKFDKRQMIASALYI